MLNPSHQKLGPSQPAPQPLVNHAVFSAEARLAECSLCGFNLDWRCEHSGCAICPGKASKLGAEPLKVLLNNPKFKCPIKKF